MEKGKLSIFTNGILRENPVLVLVLGTCPTLAMTTSVIKAVGMGLCALFVLVCSNIVISLLRRVIPNGVRIPAYIVVIAGFVTLVKMLLSAFIPSLFASLGTFLDLIVVNCIILGRAEMFASKHSVTESMLDGVGMGLGFTLALLLMALVRELLGSGSLCGIAIPVLSRFCFPILAQPAGGFLVFGVLMALVAYFTRGKYPKKKSFDCEGCPSFGVCGGKKCPTSDPTVKEKEGTA